ncbi:hypothetical protein [Tsukamurella sp. PLM1]|uniref:hypothetical protein n=1 Tax=Tsukamurella sp. PLM1 TaxID=2929795 RepID=UPI00205960D7|nr:hypothetical protein [Tsukamurella sp. PLM1]BDH56639.1 hypothetical protein MTP03_15780 [Tsukamurella sp. PLM1]
MLGAQLKALTDSCPDVAAEGTLDRWADAVEAIAEADLDTLPDDDAAALKIVAVGNVLSDQVLITLRRLAQESRSAQLYAPDDADQTSSEGPDSRR